MPKNIHSICQWFLFSIVYYIRSYLNFFSFSLRHFSCLPSTLFGFQEPFVQIFCIHFIQSPSVSDCENIFYSLYLEPKCVLDLQYRLELTNLVTLSFVRIKNETVRKFSPSCQHWLIYFRPTFCTDLRKVFYLSGQIYVTCSLVLKRKYFRESLVKI